MPRLQVPQTLSVLYVLAHEPLAQMLPNQSQVVSETMQIATSGEGTAGIAWRAVVTAS